jgi:hypothetical protein
LKSGSTWFNLFRLLGDESQDLPVLSKTRIFNESDWLISGLTHSVSQLTVQWSWPRASNRLISKHGDFSPIALLLICSIRLFLLSFSIIYVDHIQEFLFCCSIQRSCHIWPLAFRKFFTVASPTHMSTLHRIFQGQLLWKLSSRILLLSSGFTSWAKPQRIDVHGR